MTLRVSKTRLGCSARVWSPGALLFAGGALWALVAAGCAETETFRPGTTGTGGAMASPGGSGGGAPATGGAPGASGGATGAGTGGNTAAGTGGASTATGGRPAVSGGTGGSTAASSGGRAGSVLLPLPWMDDFEANTAGGPATGWIRDPKDTAGMWSVALDGATKVLQEKAAVSSVSWMVGGDSAWTDQRVEAKVKFTSVTSSSLALVASRFTSFDNYYFLHLKGDGSLKIRKRIVEGGSTTTLDVLSYKSGTALAAGTWYTVAIEIKGNVVTAYLNGSSVGTVTEPAVSLARGGIALGFQDATGGAFDDVRVTLP